MDIRAHGKGQGRHGRDHKGPPLPTPPPSPLRTGDDSCERGSDLCKALRTRLIRAAPTTLQLLHFTRTLLLFAQSFFVPLYIDAQAALGQNLLCEIQPKAVRIIYLEGFTAPHPPGTILSHFLIRYL